MTRKISTWRPKLSTRGDAGFSDTEMTKSELIELRKTGRPNNKHCIRTVVFPLYRPYKASGKAVATFDGKAIYFGKYGSVFGYAQYQEKLETWMLAEERNEEHWRQYDKALIFNPKPRERPYAEANSRVRPRINVGCRAMSTLFVMQRPGIRNGRSCSRTDPNAPSYTLGIARSTLPPHPVPSTSSPNRTTAA